MSQYDFGTIDPATKSGTTLAGDLNSWRTALHSCHSGTSRPSYAAAGTLWLDTTTNPWIIKIYDGADDITIGTVNTSTNVFTVSGLGSSAITWTAAQTFRVADAVRSEVAATQDAVVVAGRAGGTGSYAVKLTPGTLSANRTVTLPDETGTLAVTAASQAEMETGTESALRTMSPLRVAQAIAGSPTAQKTKQIQPITASVASNALTITLNPTSLDFRSSTLGSGTVNTRTVSAAISVVVSSGSTLGTVNATAARLAVIAIDNSGTVELAVTNLAGGANLDETTLISTTAEGGVGAADSASVIYSTTSRSNVPFRVVGFLAVTEATAGTWATAPSTIQGAGGNVFGSGFGQTPQNLTASRASGTTYYNTTRQQITVFIVPSASNWTLVISGTTISTGRGVNEGPITFLVPTMQSYAFTGSFWSWCETR